MGTWVNWSQWLDKQSDYVWSGKLANSLFVIVNRRRPIFEVLNRQKAQEKEVPLLLSPPIPDEVDDDAGGGARTPHQYSRGRRSISGEAEVLG